MSYITEKTVYRLMDRNRALGFEITVTDDGVDIETSSGLNVYEFIESMDALLIQLKEKYEYGNDL